MDILFPLLATIITLAALDRGDAALHTRRRAAAQSRARRFLSLPVRTARS